MMKFGLTIYTGTKEKVEKEFAVMLEKAKTGYGDKVVIAGEDTFNIVTEEITITFAISTTLGEKFAIYQMFK